MIWFQCCCVICFFFLVFLFKQKTAYEMRISDWSSDVCSSDLCQFVRTDQAEVPDVDDIGQTLQAVQGIFPILAKADGSIEQVFLGVDIQRPHRRHQIGRASCRERVCQYV